MHWLTLITRPDGTTVEVPIPTPDDTPDCHDYRYRVRGVDGDTEFATLAEVASELLDRQRGQQEVPHPALHGRLRLPPADKAG